MPSPIYEAHNLCPSYLLRYSWTAFPAKGQRLPKTLPEGIMKNLAAAWESDGIRLLEHRWEDDRFQATFSTTPQVAPTFLAARAKGRLQHALRQAGLTMKFARNFSVRALGNNTRETVERYVREQFEGGDFADVNYCERLREVSWTNPQVDLRQALCTDSGRYWYVLHLVLVTSDRYRIDAGSTARVISEVCRAVAAKQQYGLSSVSMMPDHLHLALRGAPEHSPEEIALCFQNNLAWKLGQVRIWEPNYYAGTTGEYTMQAVRTRG